MLELIRNRLIWVEQPAADGPIYLKPLTSEPAEEAVHKAIYANTETLESTPQNAQKTKQPPRSPVRIVDVPAQETPAAERKISEIPNQNESIEP